MLIVGLGNPGPQYRMHRHNVGFMVLDRINEMLALSWTERKHYAISGGMMGESRVALMKPYTFMNRSGRVVAERARFLNVMDEELVVVHDDLDLPLGSIRVKQGGGLAGHNGLRSIAGDYGSKNFVRIRVGIGRPEYPDQVRAYVLSPFARADAQNIDLVLEGAREATETFVADGLAAAQNAIHGRDFLTESSS